MNIKHIAFVLMLSVSALGQIRTEQIRDNAITEPKILDGTILNVDINASAAIAGSKVSPSFGAQDVISTTRFFANETANSVQNIGLTINQGAGGNTVYPIVLKDSQVSHGFTLVEDDTFGLLSMGYATGGGVVLWGFTDDSATNPGSVGVLGVERTGVEDTAFGTAAIPNIEMRPLYHDGAANLIAPVDNAIVFGVRAGSPALARWLVDEDGDTWQPGSIFVNESANADVTTNGITVTSGGATGVAGVNQYFTLKNSTINHGFTAITETDTFLYIDQVYNDGGARLAGFSESLTNDTGLILIGMVPAVTADTTFAADTEGTINIAPTYGVGDTVGAAIDEAQVVTIRVQPFGAGSVEAIWSIDEDGDTFQDGMVQLGAILFANLGTPADGTFAYCSDCSKATPCSGSGTGALAKRLNGSWDCD